MAEVVLFWLYVTLGVVAHSLTRRVRLLDTNFSGEMGRCELLLLANWTHLEHSPGGGNGADEEQGADQILQRLLDDVVVDGEDEDGGQTTQSESPCRPHRDNAQ